MVAFIRLVVPGLASRGYVMYTWGVIQRRVRWKLRYFFRHYFPVLIAICYLLFVPDVPEFIEPRTPTQKLVAFCHSIGIYFLAASHPG